MAAVSVHQFAQCITCHAWSPDHSMIALCPNNNEVHIYRLSEDDKWEKIHVLQKHDQIVSGVDWSISSNRIVTVSHDRNSYVWNQETTEWTRPNLFRQNSLPLRRFENTGFDLPGQVGGVEEAAPLMGARGQRP
ncbi:Actin-related protein 2/3 complex subunit 1B [Abeliophyllum distichum]|uniref:Arp2/3 complex 41 kDa subunit n=1 Tax=Abeliophyllum distichum TaxID=126358 RepID=A0ABD1QK87_9LAMI